MVKDQLKLSARLSAAASYARRGSFVADVGTDHAYLPIYLVREGIIKGAVASDIGEGPAMRARLNINKYHLENKIKVNISDGLTGLDVYSPDDIFILGMGGELIADILSRAEFTKDPRVRLVLQPMTHPEALRAYLSDNGFSITDEAVIEEDKIYQLIVAEYSGNTDRPYTPAELLIGRVNIKKGGKGLIALLRHWEKVLSIRAAGRASSKNADSPEAEDEAALLDEIKALIKNELEKGESI